MTPSSLLQSLLSADPAVYTIQAGQPFLPQLITPLLDAYEGAPEALADLTLYLPNRRATKSAGDVFAEMAEARDRPVILPQLRALGDIDEDELLVTDAPLDADLALDPPADLLSRRLMLARIVRARHDDALPWPSALKAADALGRFLDGLARDGVPYGALAAFTPADLDEEAARHWRDNLAFLSIVGEAWPAVLAEAGEMEPAERRSALLDALGDTFADRPASAPVIVAGSLGTAAATARFMAKAARAPHGLVILPGLDLSLDEDAWQEAARQETHPQSLFGRWLEEALDGADRHAVQPWGQVATPDAAAARRSFLSLALKPAGATRQWYTDFERARADGTLAAACDGLRIVKGRTEEEEASLIALLLRETLDTPGRTAMLVTPDRPLARRVAAKLAAWGILIDDSAGTPLKDTFRGTFLRLVAGFLDAPHRPGALLPLLAHPLSRWGMPIDVARRAARAADRSLRGPAPRTWGAMCDRLINGKNDPPKEMPALLDLLQSHVTDLGHAPDLRAALGVLTALCEALSATEEETGPARLWQFEDGEALSARLDDLMGCPYLPKDHGGPLLALVEALIEGPVVRRPGAHPRLSVYGLLEARLQHADRIILGGLAEGVWPAAAPEDPFLSRGMMRTLGLTVPEMLIGRAAHDFVQGAASGEVILSYPLRRERTPTTPSRWIVRLESFLEAAGLLGGIDDTDRLRALDAARHSPPDGTTAPAPRPAPAPPAATREAALAQLAVTDIGKLIRDPYAVYAHRVLGLRPLDPIEQEIGPRERGMFHHLVAENLGAEEVPSDGDWAAAAHAVWDRCFAGEDLPPEQRLLWAKPASRACDTLGAFEAESRAEGRPLGTEVEDRWAMPLPSGRVTLKGRIDRIDALSDGSVGLTDFKGSQAPTIRQDKAFDPQLSVLALMIEAGGFSTLGPRDVSRLLYLPLFADRKGASAIPPPDAKGDAGKRCLSGQNLDTHLSEIHGRVRDLLDETIYGNRPFPSQVYPEKMGYTGDYDQLARRGEWSILGTEEGDSDGD